MPSTPTKPLALDSLNTEPHATPRKLASNAVKNLMQNLESLEGHAEVTPPPSTISAGIDSTLPSNDGLHSIVKNRLAFFSKKICPTNITYPSFPVNLHPRYYKDLEMSCECTSEDLEMYIKRMGRLGVLLEKEVAEEKERHKSAVENVNRMVMEEEEKMKKEGKTARQIKREIVDYVETSARNIKKDFAGLWDALKCLKNVQAYSVAMIDFLSRRDKIQLNGDDVINHEEISRRFGCNEGYTIEMKELKYMAGSKLRGDIPNSGGGQSLEDIVKEAKVYSGKGEERMPLFGRFTLNITRKSFPQLSPFEERLIQQLMIRPIEIVYKEYAAKAEAAHGRSHHRSQTTEEKELIAAEILLLKLKAMHLSREDLTMASPFFVLNKRLTLIRAVSVARKTNYTDLNKNGWPLIETLQMLTERDTGKIKRVYKVHDSSFMIPLR